jgi:Ca2+-binding RTX toxin-like protein
MNLRDRVGRVSRNFVLASAAVAALLLGAAASASAGTLDQQQTSSNGAAAIYMNQSLAQTFTAGISGGLDRADLKLNKYGAPPPFLTVEIRTTSAGAPTNTVLASGTIPSSAVTTNSGGAFASATFATQAPVTAGTKYALVAWSTGVLLGDQYTWHDTEENSYAGGLAFASSDPVPPPPGANWNEFPPHPDSDFAFKTYVNPNATTTTCKGQPVTLVGTQGNDVGRGTPGRDVIAGLGGNDTVSGLGGNDLICGGSGKDKLKGGPGNDKLFGQSGKDTLKGGGADDTCKGGKGKDTLVSC